MDTIAPDMARLLFATIAAQLTELERSAPTVVLRERATRMLHAMHSEPACDSAR